MKASQMYGKWVLVPVVCFTLSVAALAVPTSGSAGQRPPAGAEKKKGDAAQDKKAPDKKPADAAAKGADQDEKEKYEQVLLTTEDGVAIAATYFPSKAGKNSPAVILLHGYGEKQRVFDDLAFDLQDHGYAVLTLDFRGHGRSTQWAVGHQPQAKNARLDFHDFRTAEQLATLVNDIEAAKRFLVRRNNNGELNVGKLAVVGTEMGASIGVRWSFNDWQFAQTVNFTAKQGQDVLTMVLISPQYNFKGLAITDQLKFLQQRMPMQVVVGKKDAKWFNDADKMYKSASKAYPKAEPPSELVDVNTKLQGFKLLDPDLEFEVNASIIKFLDAALRKKGVNWAAREIGESDAGR